MVWQWRARLAAFERSGPRAADFCRREWIAKASFYKRRQRLRDGSDMPRVVELQLSLSVIVRLSPHFDEATLQRVVKLLHERR